MTSYKQMNSHKQKNNQWKVSGRGQALSEKEKQAMMQLLDRLDPLIKKREEERRQTLPDYEERAKRSDGFDDCPMNADADIDQVFREMHAIGFTIYIHENGKHELARVTIPSSMLEKYITQTQEHFEEDLAKTRDPKKRKDLQLANSVSQWEVKCARKYKLTTSALAMIDRLKPERSQGIIETLPGTGIWIMCNDSLSTNFYFSCQSHAVTSYMEFHPHAKMTEDLAKLASRPWIWNMEVYTPGEYPAPRSRCYLYDANRQLWTINNMDFPEDGITPCPNHACEMTGVDQTGFYNWYICDECKVYFDFFTSWFPVALMAINGDFAETEERQERRKFTQREMRKVRRPGSGLHYDNVPVTHTYHVVTFDMSVKSPASEQPLRDHQKNNGPTWLEQAIANETVLYVSKHIHQTQRTFRAERYVNMRGKTIDVRAYDKRVPMSVKRLQQTIHKAVASK
jgi:hypothetical protein